MSTLADAPTFDLQSHSTCSDGSLAPADVVAAAAAAGVTLLALTDHDTVDGVDAAIGAARERQIGLVPAVELSAVDVGGQDFHVLGYGIDHTDGVLAERLALWRSDRAQRIERMALRLGDLGFAPERDQLDARLAADQPLGRPHLAQAAVAGHRERLEPHGLAEPSAFLEAFLVPGCPAYCRRERPTVPEAIAAVHDAGGVAVWAHPFWDVDEHDQVCDALARFKADGLDGVEAFYATHDARQTQLLVRGAAQLDLLTTGSADFHGPAHRHFSRFRAFELYGLEPRLGPVAAFAHAR